MNYEYRRYEGPPEADGRGALGTAERRSESVTLIELPLQKAAPGLYALTLQVDGLLIGSEKLIIQTR